MAGKKCFSESHAITQLIHHAKGEVDLIQLQYLLLSIMHDIQIRYEMLE